MLAEDLGVPVPPATSTDCAITPARRWARRDGYQPYTACYSNAPAKITLRVILGDAQPCIFRILQSRQICTDLAGINKRARSGCPGVPSRVLRTRDRYAPLPSLTHGFAAYYMLQIQERCVCNCTMQKTTKRNSGL